MIWLQLHFPNFCYDSYGIDNQAEPQLAFDVYLRDLNIETYIYKYVCHHLFLLALYEPLQVFINQSI